MPILELTDREFSQEVLQSKQLVLVDFWAPWCNPCQMMAPILEQIDREYKGRVKICKINVEEHTTQANNHQVLSIPTILFFKDGAITSQLTGPRLAQDIKQTIDSLL